MYLIRGIAELESGFTVRFTETVPALKNNLSFLSPVGGVVAGKSIQLGSFTPAPSEPITPSPTSPDQKLLSGCETKMIWAKEIILEVPGLGKMTIHDVHGTIFFKSASFPVSSIEEVRDSFFKIVEDQYVINVSRALSNYPSPSSIENVYTIFDKMNASSPPFGQKAPLHLHADRGNPIVPGSNFMIDKMRIIAENVTQRILEISQNDQVEFWSTKANLFPERILDKFQSLFYFNPVNVYSPYAVCYISGNSPILYLYPQIPTKITVKLGSPVTYTDPPFTTILHSAVVKNGWDLAAFPNSELRITNYEESYITNMIRAKFLLPNQKQGLWLNMMSGRSL